MKRLRIMLVFAICACKSEPDPGAQILERTRAAIDVVCACQGEAVCHREAMAKYEAIVADLHELRVGEKLVDALAKQQARLDACAPAPR